MRIHVDHRAPRQLIDGGPWVFWRQRADGTREGLVLELLPCGNRKCDCRDVGVIGHIVDPNLMAIDAGRDGLVLTYRAGGPATLRTQRAAALVSFETGEVHADTDEPDTAGGARVRTWIADEMDGGLLERLYEEWLHAKGWRQRETHREGTWTAEWKSNMGRLVGWHEAFPDSRQDMYRIGGSVSLALDHYCINPGCRCREVRVALLAAGRSRSWTQYGEILFDLDSPGATRLSPSTSPEADLVGAVRGVLDKRYDVVEHFSRRLDRLKEVGRTLQAAAQAASRLSAASGVAKAGRNDLCPCGSGRKYKKCCLNKGG